MGFTLTECEGLFKRAERKRHLGEVAAKLLLSEIVKIADELPVLKHVKGKIAARGRHSDGSRDFKALAIGQKGQTYTCGSLASVTEASAERVVSVSVKALLLFGKSVKSDFSVLLGDAVRSERDISKII